MKLDPQNYRIFLLLLIAFLINGCSQKVTVKAIVPAPIYDADIKSISIATFEDDTIHLKSNIQSILSDTQFNNKNYFTIINKDQIDTILEEQLLQDSGLVQNTHKSFELIGTRSIMTGKINSLQHDTTKYFEKRIDHNKCVQHIIDEKGKKTCTRYKEFTITCYAHEYSVNSDIKISRVSNAQNIFAKNFYQTMQIEHCQDSKKILPSPESIYKRLAQVIAQEFVSYIAPSYTYYKVILKDDPDTPLNKNQKNLFENGLKLIEKNQLEDAKLILETLNLQTNNSSIVILYNLSVVLETMGELENALSTIEKAYKLSLQHRLDEDIAEALKRIRKSVKNKNLADSQIKTLL